MPMSRRRRRPSAPRTTSATSRPSVHDRERRVGTAERGHDVVDQPVGVGREQHVHGTGRYCTAPATVTARRTRGAAPRRARRGRGRRRPAAAPRPAVRRRAGRRSGASSSRAASANARSSARLRHSAATSRRRCRRRLLGRLGRGAVAERRVDPVGHAGQPGDPVLGQLAGEPHRLGDGVAVRRRHDDVAGGVGPQQGHHVLGALAEAALHPGEGLEEGDGVGEHVGADDPADGPQHRLGGRVRPAPCRGAPAASAGGTADGRGSEPARRAPRGSRGRCGSAACRRRRRRSARRRAAGAASRRPCTPGCR